MLRVLLRQGRVAFTDDLDHAIVREQLLSPDLYSLVALKHAEQDEGEQR
jgi:hypothetical protein